MNPLVFLFVLGAATATIQKSIEDGLGYRFPIVYEYPRENIVLGEIAQQKGAHNIPEKAYPVEEQVRPIYVRTVISDNHGHHIDQPIQKILLDRQYQNEDDFPIYTPSGHNHGLPKPRPQSPTHEVEKDHHHAAPVRSFYPGSSNREIVYIYRPIQRQQFGEILRPIQPY